MSIIVHRHLIQEKCIAIKNFHRDVLRVWRTALALFHKTQCAFSRIFFIYHKITSRNTCSYSKNPRKLYRHWRAQKKNLKGELKRRAQKMSSKGELNERAQKESSKRRDKKEEIKRRNQPKGKKGEINKKSSKGEQRPKKQNKLSSRLKIVFSFSQNT